MEDCKTNSFIKNDETVDVDKDDFFRKLYAVYNNKKGRNSALLPRHKYYGLIEKIKTAKTAVKKCSADYHRLRKFEVIQTPEGERLYTLPTGSDKRGKLVVHLDEMYDIIKKYHVMLNHGGRTRIRNLLKRKFIYNVTAESISVYLSMCKSCKNKSIHKRGKLDVPDPNSSPSCDDMERDDFIPTTNPIAESSTAQLDIAPEELIKDLNTTTYKHTELYLRAQVDILSVTTELNEEYKYLMVYKNFTTKYIHLKPLKALKVDDAVEELLAIFLEYGAPNILQSKNGLDLIKPICRRLSNVHQEIKVITSEKVFNESDFKGKSNGDILKKLNDWLVKSQNTKWHQGVKYVQHDLNTIFHETLCRTPSEMVFGTNPRKGLLSVLPKDVCDDIITEQELITVLENKDPVGPKRLTVEESLILPTSFVKLEVDTDEENDDDEDVELAKLVM